MPTVNDGKEKKLTGAALLSHQQKNAKPIEFDCWNCFQTITTDDVVVVVICKNCKSDNTNKRDAVVNL